ncbi:MAG: hypothetical protein PHO48_01230 [Candidatus Gracilibacteria bacterium]|nr:hypothetical protein [Candidatus Gracilibacteria bacterium]MDD5178800.1 hypothetical protein [Candidatus Gracilibacteria bacterium]
MPKKILSGLLGLLTLLASNASAFAEIPAGYALVPISALTGHNFGSLGSANVTISPSNSALRAGDEIGYLGEAFQVVATLRDTENQPASNRAINLISSRATDSIRAIQATTDANGEAIFSVNATKEGISSFTAIDQNSGVTVTERPRVVFLKPANGIGGNYLKADALTADTSTTSAVAYQGKIVADFPASVAVNTPSDITVKITDLSGNTVTDFSDGVTFTTSDTDAILPKDYIFKEVDKGTHTFANAVTFRAAGSKSFTINSTNVAVAPLTINVVVVGEAEEVEKPVILNPTDGSVINSAITLQGLAPANSNLAAFVNSQYYAQGSSDASGNFDIDLDLPDGEYSLTAGVVINTDSVGAMSDAVSVTIDTTPPELTQIVLDPGEAATTEDNISVIIQSETDLSAASVNINGKNIVCSNEGDGFYQAKVGVLPEGDYPIAVTVTDAAGNTAQLNNAATLKVASKALAVTIETVTATPKDKRVDISWEAPANQAEVNHYAIFYGTNPENLSQAFETTDNRTAWYIGELNNDTEYTFQIASLDNNGEANGYSNPFAATPTSQLGFTASGCDTKLALTWKPQANEAIVSYQLNYGIKTREYTESQILPDGKNRSEWEMRDLINGVEYFITLRGVDATGNVVFDPQEEISATPTAGACHSAAVDQPIQLQIRKDEKDQTTLVWNPVSGAIGYKVFAGTTPNLFDLPTVTVTTPYFRPEGLMANEDYYFAVKAIYTDHEAAAFSNITKVEVGPAALLAITGIIAIAGGYFFRRKEKTLNWIRIRK